jgi:hypothetical protein
MIDIDNQLAHKLQNTTHSRLYKNPDNLKIVLCVFKSF